MVCLTLPPPPHLQKVLDNYRVQTSYQELVERIGSDRTAGEVIITAVVEMNTAIQRVFEFQRTFQRLIRYNSLRMIPIGSEANSNEARKTASLETLKGKNIISLIIWCTSDIRVCD